MKRIFIFMLFQVPLSPVYAAAMDRTGQSISAFLQPHHYFEFGLNVSDPDIAGREAGLTPTTREIDNIAEQFYTTNTALKFQLNPQFSFGILYDQPFGADAAYKGQNSFTATEQDRVLAALRLPISELAQVSGIDAPEGQTGVEIKTQNLTMLMGYQPTPAWNIYAGAAAQNIKAHINSRGNTYSIYNGYTLDIPENTSYGWLAGSQYQNPKIGFKAALTYRSKIEHKVGADERLPVVDMIQNAQGFELLNREIDLAPLTDVQKQAVKATVQKLHDIEFNDTTAKVLSPQSVNIDLQQRIRPDLIGFAQIRWVNWKDFNIELSKFSEVSKIVGALSRALRPEGFDFVDYSNDQWSANIGLNKIINPKWSSNISLGWDSGAGNPVSLLGPTEGFWSVGLGAQYQPTPATFIAGGVKYLWLGDAHSQTGVQAGSDLYLGEFKNNYALGYGLKLGYRF